jgi:hypothetical protein
MIEEIEVERNDHDFDTQGNFLAGLSGLSSRFWKP